MGPKVTADILHFSKGPVTTTHSAVAATNTSAAVSCAGFNSLMVYQSVSVAEKNWTVKIQGAMESTDTYVDWYEGATAMSAQTNTAKATIWKGVPDYVKIVATEDEDGGKCTVKIQPLNVM